MQAVDHRERRGDDLQQERLMLIERAVLAVSGGAQAARQLTVVRDDDERAAGT